MPKPNVVLKACSWHTPLIKLGKSIRKQEKCKKKLCCFSLHIVYLLRKMHSRIPHKGAVMVVSTIQQRVEIPTLDNTHYKMSSGSYGEGGKGHISYRKYNQAAPRSACSLRNYPLLCE